MSLKSTARAYLDDALTAFHRAPTEVALCVLTAVLFSYAVELDQGMEAWLQLAVGIFIVFACAWTATLVHALGVWDERKRWAVTIAGAIVAVAYLLAIQNFEREAEHWRALLLVLGTALLALAAPGWVRLDSPESLRLRRINSRFLLRAIGIGLYGLALFAGLALAIGAVDKLFELKIQGRIYAHVFGWIMLVLVPWVVAGGLEDYIRPLDEVSEVARVAFRLISFLVPPLIVVYYLILFAYIIRIIVTGELPKNLVSPMVMAAGLLTALAAILFDPQPGDTRAGARALRMAPVLFIALVPLGVWALFVRIDEYGWTEFRLIRVALLAVLLVLAVLATLQFARRRPFSIRVIPLSLAVLILLVAVGPWGIVATAKRDQQARLLRALHAAQVDPAAPLSTDTTRRAVPRELYDRINNIGFYLQQHFGESALPVPAQARSGRELWSLADHFRLTPAIHDTLPSYTYGSLPPNLPVRLSDGRVIYRVVSGNPRVQTRGTQLTLLYEGELRVDLDTILVQRAPSRTRREQAPLPAIPLPVIGVDGQQRGELILFEVAVQQQRDSIRLDRLDGLLILR